MYDRLGTGPHVQSDWVTNAYFCVECQSFKSYVILSGFSQTFSIAPMQDNQNTVLNSGFHALDSGFQVLHSRFISWIMGIPCQWVPIVSAIPESLS